jgi:hypothetical protein
MSHRKQGSLKYLAMGYQPGQRTAPLQSQIAPAVQDPQMGKNEWQFSNHLAAAIELQQQQVSGDTHHRLCYSN